MQEVFFCGSVGGETTVLSFCQGKRISYQAGSAWAEPTDIKNSLMDTYTTNPNTYSLCLLGFFVRFFEYNTNEIKKS